MPHSLYGEARRLRYFIKICEFLLNYDHIREKDFRWLLLNYLSEINLKINEHVRSTGILRTEPVARNYLSYCKWLNLINKEEGSIRPNSYTIYFAHLSNKNEFSLTKKEKISLFNILIAKNEFFELISLLQPLNTPKEFIPILKSEHLVETFLDWCVDLSILFSTTKKFGKFRFNHRFSKIMHNIKLKSKDEMIQDYCSSLLGKNILINRHIEPNLFWNKILISLNKTKEHTRSELDVNLYSAFPMILDLQSELILNYQTHIPFEQLIDMIKVTSVKYNAFFVWNYMKRGGQLKLGG